MNGLVIVNKEINYTSHDVVNCIRKIYNTKKVGHTGTLDPNVSGTIGVCIGKATKLTSFLMDLEKRYIAKVLLGIKTNTGDLTGTVVKEKKITQKEAKLIKSSVNSTLNLFLGEHYQKVPFYSAKKIKGKRLYEYARENKIVFGNPIKKVNIYNINYNNNSFNYDKKIGYITFEFDISCGKGTYIRSICEEIGREFNLPSTMMSLERINACGYSIQESNTLNKISLFPKSSLIPISKINLGLKKFFLNEILCDKLKKGKKLENITNFNTKDNEKFTIYSEKKRELIGIFVDNKKLFYKNLVTFV